MARTGGFAADGGQQHASGSGSLRGLPYPEGYLTPGQIFTRTSADVASDFVQDTEGSIPARIDPFVFLQWGG